MMFIFIICILITLYILAVVWRNQEDKDAKIFKLELELKEKEKHLDDLKDNYKNLDKSIFELNETIKRKFEVKANECKNRNR